MPLPDIFLSIPAGYMQNDDITGKPVITETADGSHTLSLPGGQETYHSRYGAIQESAHVFIRNGLLVTTASPLSILEVGFGTGLNALLTLQEAARTGRRIHYTALERYPVPLEIISRLNYCDLLDVDCEWFRRMHSLPWAGKEQLLTAGFSLLKIQDDLLTCRLPGKYDLVYFDAFSAAAQPEMWTTEVFSKTGSAMTPGGILVTYAAKGSVRRALQQTGFRVERLPGPPGKREMIRAVWKDDR